MYIETDADPRVHIELDPIPNGHHLDHNDTRPTVHGRAWGKCGPLVISCDVRWQLCRSALTKDQRTCPICSFVTRSHTPGYIYERNCPRISGTAAHRVKSTPASCLGSRPLWKNSGRHEDSVIFIKFQLKFHSPETWCLACDDISHLCCIMRDINLIKSRITTTGYILTRIKLRFVLTLL